MQSKKSNNANYAFFSESIAERLESEVNRVLMLLQSERITYMRAYNMLHDAQKDLQTLYYQTSGIISRAENQVTKLRKYGRFHGEQDPGENVLSLNTQRAIVSLRAMFGAYKSGTVSKRQVRKQARIMKDLLSQDVASLNWEIRHKIRKLTQVVKPVEVIEDRTVREKDMLVKKVSSAHDDLAR